MIFKQRGLHLIEVLLALLLMSIATTGLLRLQVYIERQSDFAARSRTAMLLAENKLQHWRLSHFSEPEQCALMRSAEEYSAAGVHLKWQVVNELNDTLKRIQLVASWVDHSGETHSVMLTTMLSCYSELIF